MTPAHRPPKRYGLPRHRRLHGQKTFAAVYANRLRTNVGPLSLCGLANGMAMTRVGLSLSGAVGTAVARNRIKRLLREAFRLDQHELPGGYDVVVVVRPHQPASLEQYRQWLGKGLGAVDAEHRRRQEQC